MRVSTRLASEMAKEAVLEAERHQLNRTYKHNAKLKYMFLDHQVIRKVCYKYVVDPFKFTISQSLCSMRTSASFPLAPINDRL